MPKDISSSSSEDEADSPATGSAAKQREAVSKTTRYQCPADFVSFSHVPCSSTLTDSLKSSNNELWLIKAPASFNPECFSGIKVPLSGLQTLKVPAAAGGAKTASGQQIYSVLASNQGTAELHLLTSDKRSSDCMVFGPTFAGLLNVCESFGDSSRNQIPQVIPAAPAPSIPPGLKQRFHPFGSKTPTLTAEDEADGAAFGPSSSTLKRSVEEAGQEEEEEEEEGRKKKKKKKKDKRMKLEEEAVKVKEEPAAEIQEQAVQEEKRKKKKKKKDRERQEEEEEEPGVEVKVEEEVTVKCEPMDASYGDAEESSGKKKKKKKKSKSGDD
ncbi:DNA-directed RNA polymerase I subunit RPA34 [Stegastes partitus]|uniref:CD3e molecule associated protein n=1 Tax=Stegastes partitus TaxID=144197 RepID=A0A3B5AFI8_9TELE|nr:PREDICTED: DNA-directed RNA polymerase I subunit RPA34 [Stegastes partitus]